MSRPISVSLWLLGALGLLARIGLAHPDAEADSHGRPAGSAALGDWRPFSTAAKGFEPGANLELVPNAEYAIGSDAHGPIVRVNMLKIEDLHAVPGIKKVWKAGYPEPKKGDTFSNLILSEVFPVGESDGLHAIACVDWYKSRVARYDDRGKCVWVSDDLPPRAGDESRLPVVDLDGDGVLEVLSPTKNTIDGGGGVVCLDAKTGRTRWHAEFAGGVHKVQENPTVVGRFFQAETLGVAVRIDKTLYCLDPTGAVRWERQLTEQYDYGHELYASDVDGDGLDEIFVSTESRMTALRGDGSILWRDTTSLGHSDLIACADVDGDGAVETVYDHDGCGGAGPLYIVDAVTGDLEATVDYRASGLKHAQGGVVGRFRSDLPGLQILLNDKITGIYLFDSRGELLWKRDAPGSLASSGDWDGDGDLEALCFALGTNRDGVFSVWDGHGHRRYAISFLPSPVHLPGISHAAPAGRVGRLHQSDLTGNGKADVVMSFGRWGNSPDQYLFLMGEPDEEWKVAAVLSERGVRE